MAAKLAVRSDTWPRVTLFTIRICSEFRSGYLGIIFSLYVPLSHILSPTLPIYLSLALSLSLCVSPSLYLYFSFYISPLPLPRTCLLRLTTTVPFPCRLHWSPSVSCIPSCIIYHFTYISSLTSIWTPSLQPYFSSRYSAQQLLTQCHQNHFVSRSIAMEWAGY